MKPRNRLQTSVHIVTARIDDARANDFIQRVNEGLERPPYYSLDNPVIVEALVDEYFLVVDGHDDFQYKLGRVAARYLQKIPSPMTDRITKPSTDNDVLMIVTSTVARSINERRRASGSQSDISE